MSLETLYYTLDLCATSIVLQKNKFEREYGPLYSVALCKSNMNTHTNGFPGSKVTD